MTVRWQFQCSTFSLVALILATMVISLVFVLRGIHIHEASHDDHSIEPLRAKITVDDLYGDLLDEEQMREDLQPQSLSQTSIIFLPSPADPLVGEKFEQMRRRGLSSPQQVGSSTDRVVQTASSNLSKFPHKSLDQSQQPTVVYLQTVRNVFVSDPVFGLVDAYPNMIEEVPVRDTVSAVGETFSALEVLQPLALPDVQGGYTSQEGYFRIHGRVAPYGEALVTLYLRAMWMVDGTVYIEVAGVSRNGDEIGLYHREYLVYLNGQGTFSEIYPLPLTVFSGGYVRLRAMVCARGMFSADGQCTDPHPLPLDEIAILQLVD